MLPFRIRSSGSCLVVKRFLMRHQVGRLMFQYRWACVVFSCILLTSFYIRMTSDFTQIENLRTERLGRKSRELKVLKKNDFYEKGTHSRGLAKNPRIFAADKFVFRYVSLGALFNESGIIGRISSNITTSLVHSFSPYTEQKVAKIFPDPPKQNVYYANSPAIVWHKGELIVIMRIWLEEERYEKRSAPNNYFLDNYFYTQKFDAHMRPITSGNIMGVPTRKLNVGSLGDGPIEPRLFKVKYKEGSGNTNTSNSADYKLFFSFNTGIILKGGYWIDYTLFYNYDDDELIIPQISNGGIKPQLRGAPRDKHWSAFNYKDQLHFVHSLDPLRVMKCNITGHCAFIYSDDDPKNIKFDDKSTHLRGGTPVEHYSGKYYITIAHGTFFKSPNWKRFYTSHIVVLHADPFRVVYVSDDVRIHKELLYGVPIVREQYIQTPFIFPVGLLLEDDDTAYIGVHISDHSSVLLRLRGLRMLMSKVIAMDKAAGSTKGPLPQNLQTFVRVTTSEQYNLKFIH